MDCDEALRLLDGGPEGIRGMSAMVHPRCVAVNEATQKMVYKEITQSASVTDCRAYLQCGAGPGDPPDL